MIAADYSFLGALTWLKSRFGDWPKPASRAERRASRRRRVCVQALIDGSGDLGLIPVQGIDIHGHGAGVIEKTGRKSVSTAFDVVAQRSQPAQPARRASRSNSPGTGIERSVTWCRL